MATFIILRHPVTILVTAYTKTNKFYLRTFHSQTTDNKSVRCPLFSASREYSVNRKYLRALTLVGSPRDIPEPDPLAERHLNNQQLINWSFIIIPSLFFACNFYQFPFLLSLKHSEIKAQISLGRLLLMKINQQLISWQYKSENWLLAFR